MVQQIFYLYCTLPPIEIYATCLKTEKLRISKSIVAAVREINGRFLEREDGKTSTTLDEKDADGNPVKWRDIGDKKAIEKTSQALREGQPKLLKNLTERQQSAGGVLARVSNNSISHEGSTVASTMSSSQQGNNINDGNMALNNFLQMQNNASANNNNNNSDTDTCSTARRRVS